MDVKLVESGIRVNVENDAAKNDVHDTFLPKEKNQDLQNLSNPTDEKAVASVEPEKKEVTDNPDACTHETRVSRPVVATKNVKKGIFFRKTRGENQNGKKIVPVNQHQEEKHSKECWGAKNKDPSQTNNAVNKPVSKGVSKKIAFWKRNKQNHIGKKVAPTEQKQGDKDGGHVFEGDSRLVKEGGEITTTKAPKLANVANEGDAVLVKELEESITTTAPMLVNLNNVPSAKSMEVITHPDNGTHIHNHYIFYGETHIHNHGLELHRNKTYTSSYSAPNGTISTGNRSKNTVNNNGRNTSQPTRRESF